MLLQAAQLSGCTRKTLHLQMQRTCWGGFEDRLGEIQGCSWCKLPTKKGSCTSPGQVIVVYMCKGASCLDSGCFFLSGIGSCRGAHRGAGRCTRVCQPSLRSGSTAQIIVRWVAIQTALASLLKSALKQPPGVLAVFLTGRQRKEHSRGSAGVPLMSVPTQVDKLQKARLGLVGLD